MNLSNINNFTTIAIGAYMCQLFDEIHSRMITY